MKKGFSAEFCGHACRCVAFDNTRDLLRGWEDQCEPYFVELVDQNLRSLQDRANALPAYCRGLEVNEAGRLFLVKRSQFLRFAAQSHRQARENLYLSWLVAAAVSGHRVSIPGQAFGRRTGCLLEGTNLFVDPQALGSGELVLNGESGVVEGPGGTTRAVYSKDRVVAESFSTNAWATIAGEGGFFSFYRETGAPHSPKRHLVLDSNSIAGELSILIEARRQLDTNYAAIWNCIQRFVLYLNWSDRPGLTSEIDPREPASSIRLGQLNQIRSKEERVAWLAYGLYREAKRLQFQATFRADVPPGKGKRATIYSFLGEDLPHIPCAWKGTPTPRSIPEHLVALQALTAATSLFLRILSNAPTLSSWTRRRLEIDLRGINGGFGSLILGLRFLTPQGRALADCLRRDYALYLIPALSSLLPSSSIDHEELYL